MIGQLKVFIRTLFRYLYFKLVRLIDIICNSHKPACSLGSIKTILLIEVQDIGDTIIASPCIRQVRKRFPDATIDMLVQSKSLTLVRYNPNLSKAYGVTNITSYIQLFQVAFSCRRKRYDLVMSLSPSVRNNLIAALSGAKVISGYINDPYFLSSNYHDQPIELRGFKSDKAFTWHKKEPLIVRALKPAAAFGIDLTDYVDTELFLSEDARQFADIFFKKHDIDSDRLFIGLHPVCLNRFRNWPPEKFAILGDMLIEHLGNVTLYLIGSKDDKPVCDHIIFRMRYRDNVVCDLATSIEQTASIIGRCDVLIGMDSCPSDIAGALNVPTIHMHGPTDPRVTGPGGRKNFPVVWGVPCSPCGLNINFCPHNVICMNDLDVSKVFATTLEALKKYSPVKYAKRVDDRKLLFSIRRSV